MVATAVLKVLSVVPLDLEEVDNVLGPLVELALEVIMLEVPAVTGENVVVPEVTGRIVVVEILEVAEVVLSVVAEEDPETLSDVEGLPPLEEDVPGTGSVEETPGDELDCGVPAVELEAMIVETGFELVLGAGGC